MSIRVPLLTTALAFSAGAAMAQSFSTNGRPTDGLPKHGAEAVLTAATLSQSNSTTITSGNSISCNSGPPGFFHRENSYYRAFTLSLFNLDLPQFRVESVIFGIEVANDGAGAGQPLTVRIFDSTTNPPTTGSLNLRATETVSIPDQASSTIAVVPITAQPVFTVATEILVVEIFTPDGQAAMNEFLIGSNAGGQTGPSFIRAADCSIPEITDLAVLGFMNMNIVMAVAGNTQTPVSLTGLTIE